MFFWGVYRLPFTVGLAVCGERCSVNGERRNRLSPVERFAAGGVRQFNDVILWPIPESFFQLTESRGAAVADRRRKMFEHAADDRTRRPAQRHTHLKSFGA